MDKQKLRVLLVIAECNPEWASVPLVGYKFFSGIDQLADVTLVTHVRNKPAIDRLGYPNVIYISESKFMTAYYQVAERLSAKIWPLYHTLTYPIYEEFNRKVYQTCQAQIQAGAYDVVHVMTPMMPRYPVKLVQACENTPFMLGPVNGGVPFPDGFREVAKKEHAHLNFLRAIGRWLLPGYMATYRQADRILAGSTYTLNMVKDMFNLPDRKLELFYENGIDSEFLGNVPAKTARDKVNLLFVGRLVPYKGADMLLDAIAQLQPIVREKIHLTIVGDGQERNNLEAQARRLGLEQVVQFAGWVNQEDTLTYYQQSDLFCFPSIREFGGAVVLEAMGCGLPCIVANNGGIGEYVTHETGFRIEPRSREYLTHELAEKITLLVQDPALREQMSAKAIERVRDFEWPQKARRIVNTYHSLIASKKSSSEPTTALFVRMESAG